jgi:hypothetical protein
VTGTIEQLAEIIDLDAAVRLCRTVGGVSWYIPNKASPDHRFVEIIGQEAWSKLCAVFGGTELTLPRGDLAYRRRRALELIKAVGMSARQIAIDSGTTERHVRRLRAELNDDRQGELPFLKGE